MIVSHSHRFIFVRPRKVASSSLEICLSQLLARGDMLTPQTERDSKAATRLPEGVTPRFFHGFGRFGLPIVIGGHDPVTKAYRLFGPRIASYRVIAAERNPWDRAISLFYWSNRRNDMRARPLPEQVAAFRAYVRDNAQSIRGRWFPPRLPRPHRALSQRGLYSIDSVPVVDVMLRFERLEEDLRGLSQMLDLKQPLDLSGIHAKTGYRNEASRDLDTFYDAPTRQIVAEICAWEIDALNYAYGSAQVGSFTPHPRREAVRGDFASRFRRRG